MDNYRPLPGTLLDDVDTPSLIIDLDALDYNLQAISDLYKDTECKMRQHTKKYQKSKIGFATNKQRRDCWWCLYSKII